MTNPIRRRIPATLAIFVFVCTALLDLQAQEIGLDGGFPYLADPLDTVTSGYLPTAYDGPAGNHGFVVADSKGDFMFEDGTPVRFVGMTISGSACFPDSLNAISEARRLRKLGVNLARFRYMDFSYDWGQSISILDRLTGFRTIQAEQAKKFDWFVYQLAQNGIYSSLTLLSARIPMEEDGMDPDDLDTIPWLGRGMQYLYPAAREAHKTVAYELLNHTNPYTGNAYKNEPAVATLELLHSRELNTFHRLGWDLPGSGVFSYRMIRRLDTLYADWLADKYGSTESLADAWNVVPPAGGYPTLIEEGSFEGEFQSKWTFNAGNAVSVFPILSQDSVPDGDLALTLRISNSDGDVYDAFMWQYASLDFNKIYRLSFRARCSSPGGRTIQAAFIGGQGALSPGVNETVEIHPWWEEHEVVFINPVQNTTPVGLYFFYGNADDNLTIDDVRLTEVAPVGLTQGERLEDYSVVRNPYGANVGLSADRFRDDAEFYNELERDYLTDVRTYVKEVVGAKQLLAGAEHNYAGTISSVATQDGFDFTMSGQGWDYTSTPNGTWQIINYSPLRLAWSGPTYYHAEFAQRNVPMITSLSTPFPNRYIAESMLHSPAYLLLQGWDGFIFDHWDDELANNRRDYVDSADFHSARNNPVIASLLPAVSQIVRHGLLSPARTTIRLQHTRDQLAMSSRLGSSWGNFAVPGGMSGLSMAISRIQIDSLDATEFTQANDFDFEGQADGEVTSDTREIHWEYARGLFSLDSPYLQAVSGVLSQPGGINLEMLDIDAFTFNETATVVWVPLDSARELTTPGRSLLTVITRSEPNGMVWSDTTTVSVWGSGPMLVEPARLLLEFKADADVKSVIVTPLDNEGMPTGDGPLEVIQVGNNFRVMIDQTETEAVWYAVEYVPAGTSVEEPVAGMSGRSLRALPNIVDDRGVLLIDMPNASDHVRVELFDGLGRLVRTVHEGSLRSGATRLEFETEGVPSGSYLARAAFESGETVSTPIIIAR